MLLFCFQCLLTNDFAAAHLACKHRIKASSVRGPERCIRSSVSARETFLAEDNVTGPDFVESLKEDSDCVASPPDVVAVPITEPEDPPPLIPLTLVPPPALPPPNVPLLLPIPPTT